MRDSIVFVLLISIVLAAAGGAANLDDRIIDGVVKALHVPFKSPRLRCITFPIKWCSSVAPDAPSTM